VSDYETSQRKHNLVVGLFVILGICAFVWLILKFGDLPGIVTKLDSFEVFVQFPTAPGVQKDTPVLSDRKSHKYYGPGSTERYG